MRRNHTGIPARVSSSGRSAGLGWREAARGKSTRSRLLSRVAAPWGPPGGDREGPAGGGLPRPSPGSCDARAARTDPARGLEILKKAFFAEETGRAGREVPILGARADAPTRHPPLPPARRFRQRLRRWAVPRASARARRDAERTACIERRHLASRGIGGAARIPAELTLGPGIAFGWNRVPSACARQPSPEAAVAGHWGILATLPAELQAGPPWPSRGAPAPAPGRVWEAVVGATPGVARVWLLRQLGSQHLRSVRDRSRSSVQVLRG